MPEKNVLSDPIKNVSESTWETLLRKKIYFGHQSVGYNILNGIKDIMTENPQIKLNIVQTTDPEAFKSPILAHSEIGKNTDPSSKCDDFIKLMEKGIGKRADIAFMKFCYVDVTEGTDVQKVFDKYKSMIDYLKKAFPEKTFIHVTVPLTAKQTGAIVLAKNVIKRIMGKTVRSYKDNIKRNEFNKMLLTDYAGKEPIFDLARIESTFPNGERLMITEDGRSFFSLVPAYTDDGGHLNKLGRKLAAQQLLALLVKLSEKDSRK